MFNALPLTTSTTSTTTTMPSRKKREQRDENRNLECQKIFKTLQEKGWIIPAIANQLGRNTNSLYGKHFLTIRFSSEEYNILQKLLTLPPETNSEHLPQKEPSKKPTHIASKKIVNKLEKKYSSLQIANFLDISLQRYSDKKKGTKRQFSREDLEKLQEAQVDPSRIQEAQNKTLSPEKKAIQEKCLKIIANLHSLDQTNEVIANNLGIQLETYNLKCGGKWSHFTQNDLNQLKLMLDPVAETTPYEQPPSKKQKTSAEPLTSSSSYSFSLFKDFNNSDRSFNLLASDIPEAEVVDLNELTTDTQGSNLIVPYSLKRPMTG